MEAMTAGGKLFQQPTRNGTAASRNFRAAPPASLQHSRTCLVRLSSCSFGKHWWSPSIHPDLPASSGELVVRRGVSREGLRLMQRVHLIEERITEGGLRFLASDDTPSFVSTLQAPTSSS
jgi:hypothetical protein